MIARGFLISAVAGAHIALFPLMAWATEGGEGATSSGGLPQIKAEWFPSQLFWLAVTFVVLLAFFGLYALPRLGQTMQDRTRKIADDMAAAEALSAKAKDIASAYEHSMAKARDRAAEAMRQVDARIKEKTSDMMYAHRTKFTQEVARAEEDLDDLRRDLAPEMQRVAAEVAAKAATLILGTPTDAAQAQMVIESLSRQKAA